MHWIDIIYFVCVALLANYYSQKGILPIKRILLNSTIGLAYILLIIWLINTFQPDSWLSLGQKTRFENIVSLLKYIFLKPTGIGIVIYAVPLIWLQWLIRKKSHQWVQLGFRNKITNILGSAWVSLLQVSVLTGVIYFFIGLIFNPKPIQPGDSKFLSFLSLVEQPLLRANKYDYMMYGYMLRDQETPKSIQRELRQLTFGMQETDALTELTYWVGDKLQFDSTKMDIINTVFPGFTSLDTIIDRGQGIAIDFARLFHNAATFLGFESRIVIGKSKLGSTFVDHAWVEVKIYEDWVGIDPTWSNTHKEVVVTLKEELALLGRSRITSEEAEELVGARVMGMLPSGAEVKLVRGKLWFGNLDESKYLPYSSYSLKEFH